ncbi:MAG: S-adenosylmethionine:tRNA ribosyltransferase-isomerase [Tannerella sp.]|jgi:S-adenosylmethionine:tRNA ribosyltransferase-isomerase|nr:S-adenosylmethionine:tRNA ribosyltransferase-isomerase [Tannerella sp.]
MNKAPLSPSLVSPGNAITDYDYLLPDERIAKYPLQQRDSSKLLIYKRREIKEDSFNRLPQYLPMKSFLVFNNTRVIQARLLFRKATGAQIEIFCLEPADPTDYSLNFQQTKQCSWYCLVGNLKKWKEGVLKQIVRINDESIVFSAERKTTNSDTHLIVFTWDHPSFTFAEVLEAAGQLPIPPYLHRATEQSDLQNYQTVYSKIKGSVAAPTAGLHFTPEMLEALKANNIETEEITLHVGAGTFKPVKTETVSDHTMHTEYFAVHRRTIVRLLENPGYIIAVGTTSVRTLESLYHVGVTLAENPDATAEELVVKQWTAYETKCTQLTPIESLRQILNYMDRRQLDQLISATQIMIVPGYTFRMIQGVITNFHQPQSTLLLLVSAFVGGNWRAIYDYALTHDFRFLSYGDCSLLL